jgi:hypothetical protein
VQVFSQTIFRAARRRAAPDGQGPHPHDIFIGADLVLGREDFKTRIEQMTQRQTRPGRLGRPRTDGAEEAVSDYYVL